MSRTISFSAVEDDRVAALHEELGHVLGEVATGEIDAADGVGHGEAFVDGDGVGDTIARVEDDTGGAAGGVEREDGLDADVHSGDVEGLEHDLRHLLAVDLGVHGSFGEEDVVAFGVDAELVVEGVVPDEFHVVPVGDDAVLDGVRDGENALAAERVVADEVVLGGGAEHGVMWRTPWGGRRWRGRRRGEHRRRRSRP